MYHIIINPVAGHGYGLTLIENITRAIREHGKTCVVWQTRAPLDAKTLAEAACEAGSEGVLGIGGDGTLQEIVSGMFAFYRRGQIETPFGFLPFGSGNDFWLSLTKGKRFNKKHTAAIIAQWLDNVCNRRTRRIDIIDVNGTACVNIANVGLDALIVRNAARYKSVFKGNAYLASAFVSIMQHKHVTMRIETDAGTQAGSFILVALCNGQYYGSGMRIAPEAQIDDGLITVCAIRAIKKPMLLALFPSVLAEWHVRLKVVSFFTCKRAAISFDGTQTFCLDGNLYDHTETMTFAVVPKALELFWPTKICDPSCGTQSPPPDVRR